VLQVCHLGREALQGRVVETREDERERAGRETQTAKAAEQEPDAERDQGDDHDHSPSSSKGQHAAHQCSIELPVSSEWATTWGASARQPQPRQRQRLEMPSGTDDPPKFTASSFTRDLRRGLNYATARSEPSRSRSIIKERTVAMLGYPADQLPPVIDANEVASLVPTGTA
jgi:hypothetical protein